MNKRPYNILCTICARGGSKGVKNKNIRPLLGKPLISHTIEQAKSCGLFAHIVISTDSEEIAKVAIDYGAEVFFTRSKELSNDHAGKLQVIKDAYRRSEEHYKTQFDYHFDLDATSPLREVSDIHNAFEAFLAGGYDVLQTAMTSRRSPYFNLIELDEYGFIYLSKTPEKPILRRQDSPKCYDLNASIYIWTRDAILNKDTIFGKGCGLYVMPEERSIDIDNEIDFEFVEFIMRKRKNDASM
jgi:CMP-N,N'-diacetyllegionaminic acid synthase